MREQPDAVTFTSSAGHVGATGSFLDAHFEACRPAYEAMLHSVGLQIGWRVLDAGCGHGNFIPLIADAVGPTGKIAALDLAPENISSVEHSLATWHLTTPVTTHVGSVLALPFPDHAFDAVWCANTLEYLTDTDFAAALRECCRVVRPGGLVAIKDAARVHTVFAPGDQALFWRTYAAVAARFDAGHGQLRSPQTRRWLEGVGLRDVWQQTTLIEWWAPLRPVEREFISANIGIFAALARDLDLSAEDHAFWEKQCDASSPEHLINRPDFYRCEGHVLAVGCVPEDVA